MQYGFIRMAVVIVFVETNPVNPVWFILLGNRWPEWFHEFLTYKLNAIIDITTFTYFFCYFIFITSFTISGYCLHENLWNLVGHHSSVLVRTIYNIQGQSPFFLGIGPQSLLFWRTQELLIYLCLNILVIYDVRICLLKINAQIPMYIRVDIS